MNPDVTKMTPTSFAQWLRDQHELAVEMAAIAARDRALLEAAARRAGADRNSPLWDAILGEPRFVRGQLVRSGGLAIYRGESAAMCEGWEPVKAHIDPEGRVIVDKD